MAKNRKRKEDNAPMFFSAFNYKLIGLSIGLIIAGFAAMRLENKVDGIISLYVAPIVVMAGFVLVIFAIMKHDRVENKNESITTK